MGAPRAKALSTSEASALSGPSLPILIDRATRRLSEARTSAEVLEAKAIAETALHYARVTKAANETHADCLRMIVRAELRMANEIDAGQASGEVAKSDGSINQWVSEDRTATLEDLGVTRQRLAEWRELRDAGPDVVEAAIQEALSENRAPTKADIRRSINPVHFSSESAEHYTPQWLLKIVHEVFGDIPDLDPCSNNHQQPNVAAHAHFTTDDDGLKQRWYGQVFMNPPYGRDISAWIEKLREEWDAQRVTAIIALLPARPDTDWFEMLTSNTDDAVICFLRGRLTFIGNHDPAPFPSMVVYFGSRHDWFARSFLEHGSLWQRPAQPLEWFVDHT